MSILWARPPGAPELGTDELHIWRISLDADVDSIRCRHDLLSADEADRAARFVFARDRDRFVVARGALREILGAYLHMHPGELRFCYSPYGKPSLAMPGDPQLDFNLSHSGDLALYALAWRRRVGVDIEYLRHDLDYAAILPGIFSVREQRVLATLSDEQRRRAFFSGWVRKEAYLKARGEGLGYAPDRVEVSLLPHETAALSLPDDAGITRWSLHALDPGEGYAAAVVAEGDPTRVLLYAL